MAVCDRKSSEITSFLYLTKYESFSLNVHDKKCAIPDVIHHLENHHHKAKLPDLSSGTLLPPVHRTRA